MARKTVKPPRKFLQVRIPMDLVDRIDDMRGLAPREAFVRELLSEIITWKTSTAATKRRMRVR